MSLSRLIGPTKLTKRIEFFFYIFWQIAIEILQISIVYARWKVRIWNLLLELIFGDYQIAQGINFYPKS